MVAIVAFAHIVSEAIWGRLEKDGRESDEAVFEFSPDSCVEASLLQEEVALRPPCTHAFLVKDAFRERLRSVAGHSTQCW